MTSTFTVRDSLGKIDDLQYSTRRYAERMARALNLHEFTGYAMYYGGARFVVIDSAPTPTN